MKKRVPAFFTGALSAVLMCAIVSTALAVGGTLAYNGFNVAIFGEQKVAVGENFETESGTQAPSTITYIDETGAGTNYISLRLMAQLLGANVVWDGSNKTVDFAATSSGNFEIIQGGMPGYKNMTTVPTLGTTAGPFTEVAPQQEKEKFMSIWIKRSFVQEPDSLTSYTISVRNWGTMQRYKLEIMVRQ